MWEQSLKNFRVLLSFGSLLPQGKQKGRSHFTYPKIKIYFWKQWTHKNSPLRPHGLKIGSPSPQSKSNWWMPAINTLSPRHSWSRSWNSLIWNCWCLWNACQMLLAFETPRTNEGALQTLLQKVRKIKKSCKFRENVKNLLLSRIIDPYLRKSIKLLRHHISFATRNEPKKLPNCLWDA